MLDCEDDGPLRRPRTSTHHRNWRSYRDFMTCGRYTHSPSHRVARPQRGFDAMLFLTHSCDRRNAIAMATISRVALVNARYLKEG
jgi:hypothetical protein